MQLASLIEIRAQLPQRISWCAIFMKAFAIVAAKRPELRRSYISFPWGYIYEHPTNVASFSLERQFDGEDAVFFARASQPGTMSLGSMDALVRAHKRANIRDVKSYRDALLLSRLPLPVRRFLWWLGLETDGRYKACLFGTFAISVVASFGAAGLHILSPLATTLNYGTFEPDGHIDVRLAYDHRVYDGATAARALVALEEVLLGEILEELKHELHRTSHPTDLVSESEENNQTFLASALSSSA